MSSGLFSIFHTARTGMTTQQQGLSVTNHNIANANTPGYSRQRAEIVTNRPFSNPTMNSYIGPGQIGTGSQVAIIRRVRDEFLDYQIRQETSTLGKYNSRFESLSEIELIFNEPSTNGISGLVGKFFDSWQQLSKQPESSNAKTVVREQAEALAKELNNVSKQLTDLKNNTNAQIKETIAQVNNILDQVNDLNQQIMSVNVTGQEPNDLMDKRDLLLDELSGLMGVEIDKKQFYTIDLKPLDAENLPPGCEGLLVRKDPNHAVSRFSYISSVDTIKGTDGKITGATINYMKHGSSQEQSTINIEFEPGMTEEEKRDVIRKLEENPMLWANEEGTSYSDKKSLKIGSISEVEAAVGQYVPKRGKLSGLMSMQEDINKYMGQMDKLAKGMAMSVNSIHSQSADGSTGLNIFVNGSEGGTEEGITAANIKLNKEIEEDAMKIIAGADGSGATDGRRALAIGQLRDIMFEFQKITDDMTREDFIKKCTGGFAENEDIGGGIHTIVTKKDGMTTGGYFKDIIDELGIQTQEAKRIVENQGTLLAGFEERKESVSGVSLDEEMTNLIMFQHAYGASAKVIATVNEMLDVVINGLIR